MVNVRAKGARAELEVARLLQPVVTKVYEAAGLPAPVIVRNLAQSRNGGYDLDGVEWLALEVKRHEKVLESGIDGWWLQAREQSGPLQHPVLFWRPGKTAWSVRMYGYLCVGPNGGLRVKTRVDITLEAFLAWFEQMLIADVNKKVNNPL